jgi:iron complex outermembrane receptor protein
MGAIMPSIASNEFHVAKPPRTRRMSLAIAAGLLCCTALTVQAHAQSGETTSATVAGPAAGQDADAANEIVVTGSLGALPLKGQGTVFGFDKTLVETPRSASSISSEQIERFGVTKIYDLISQVPGTFTNSYFGTGGAVDIRGSPADVYFRGVQRLANPGNYPTPIGASDRIDIVRGPSSPIYGPSKTGGYINFVPKTARAANGSYVTAPTGFISYTRSSWDGNDFTGSITGPGKIGDHPFGYSLYGEVEDDGSYYRNMDTKQTIVQASFDTDITSHLRTEFGGMFQHFAGQQNGGWNRLTQDLIDNGTYITGRAKPLDTNGDGQISREEARAANDGKGLSVFGNFGCPAGTTTGASPFPGGFTNACLTDPAGYPDLALTDVGTAKLSRRDTLTGPDDYLRNTQTTGYFDLIYDGADTLQVKNQLFYDGTRNRNANAYGFSQFIKSYVIEDKIVAAKTFTSDAGKFSIQASPSIRYTNFRFGDDFDIEEFGRVDLIKGYDATSDRLLSVECNCDYTDYLKGHYTDYGLAGLADLDFSFGLDLVLGGRYDYVKAKTGNPDLSKIDPVILASRSAAYNARSTHGHDDGWSWNASASYKLPFGLIPYITASKQSTIVVGEGSEVYPDAVMANNFIAASKLYEAGIKGEFLNKRLYAAVDVYKQTRTDFNNQNSVTNQSVRTKGVEAELRWSVDRHLLVSAAYTYTDVIELSALKGGTTFSFFGIGDLPQLNPALYQGGQLEGLLLIDGKEAARRAGIPKNLYSATATYAFDNGIALSGDVSHVDSVYSGQSQVVKLPAYWLANVGVSYTSGPFLFRVVVKNINNAHYFRANFTELFGSTIALPEVPRNFQATVEYKF